MPAAARNRIAPKREQCHKLGRQRRALWDAVFVLEDIACAIGDSHPLHKGFALNAAKQCRKVLDEVQS